MNQTNSDRSYDFKKNMPDTMRGCVLTIGNFDGVHLGHRQLLSRARSLADESGSSVVAMTFDPPPDLVIRPKKFPERISPPSEKILLLMEAGADFAVTVPANEKLLAMSPDQFVDRIVMRNFAPKHIVEGPNFHFGSGRGGTIDSLREMGRDRGFDVHIVQCLYRELDGESTRVCSTLIRELIKSGRVSVAAEFLTRPFALTGTVVRGEGIGRELDYPTANITQDQQVIPADGVYAARAVIDGASMTAAVSIGTRPTFDGGHTIEAYLLADVEDLYGREMTLKFIQRVRDQIKFSDAEQLKQKIAEDIIKIREILDID